MSRRWRITLVTVVVLVVAYAFLLRETHAPTMCSFTLDVPQLRALAASMPGPRAKELRVEQLTHMTMPGAVVVTGAPWALTEMQVYAYELVFDDKHIVIDTAMSKSAAAQMHASGYDDAAWGRLRAAMSTASAIYVTHEHADHLGGLVEELGTPSVFAAAHLTSEQLAHPERLDPVTMPAAAHDALRPLDYDGAIAVAPGVVLVKAPGHTPGSQLVFIQLASGEELLLTGDTAWHTENIDEVRGPPWLTSLILHNDRQANACQLLALHGLAQKEPKLHLVPGHDARVIHALTSAGVLAMGFR